MAVENFTFPQSGDSDDAEHFASMIGRSNATSYVETGLSFTYNSSVPSVDVSQGKGFIPLSSGVASSSGEDILEINHSVQVPQQTVSLTDSSVNYIYLEPNFGTDDNGDVNAYTSTQPGDALLIGTIDTSNDSVTELNRDPEIDAERIGLGNGDPINFGDMDDYSWFYDESQDRLALENDSGTRLADIGDSDWQMELDLDLQNNNLDSVSSIDGDGSPIQFDDSLNLTGHSIDYDMNATPQSLISFPVDSNSAAGTEHSYDLEIDGNSLLKAYSESDGSGSIQNEQVDLFAETDLNSNDLVDGSTVIWDSSNSYIDQSVLENDSISVNGGNGLKNGGSVSLGSSISLDIEPADFAGGVLKDDGSDNLTLNIGRGIEDDGSGKIQFDEDTSYTFTSQQSFDSGIDTSGDLVDGSTVIWNSSSSYIEQSVLQNDSISVNGGSGLKNGGSVSLGSSISLDIEPSDFAGDYLKDGGSDNLTLDIGRGLEDDGTGTIQFDEDTSYTFTTQQSFDAGIDTSGDIVDGSTTIWNSSSSQIEQSSLENDSISVNGGNGLKNGGSVSLGSSISLDIEPADFAGGVLKDDGSDNLTLNIGRGIEDDGSGKIQFDEDTSYTFTTQQSFDSGLDTSGDLVDGSTVIWNSSNSYIEQSSLENDSISFTGGNGLKNAGTVSLGSSTSFDVEPSDFAGDFLKDDGSDNLTLDIGRGLENDGTGSIQFDEDTSYTFNPDQTFNSGLTIRSGTSISYPKNAGDELIADMSVDGGAPSGATMSYGFGLDTTQLFRIYSESDGSGSIQNEKVDSFIDINLDGNDINSVNAIGGGGSSIDFNDSINVPTDSIDAVDVNIGKGLENDGSDQIQFDEDTSYTFTSQQNFNSGIDTSGDLVDGSTTIWNSSNGYIEQNSLQNDSLTVGAGDGLKGGGSISLGGSAGINIEPADFAGKFLRDDGTDNLRVNIGEGIESDGSDQIRVDEDHDFTFTSRLDFNSGMELNNDSTIEVNATKNRTGGGAGSIRGIGSLHFENEETDQFNTSSEMIWDGSAGFVFNDNLDLRETDHIKFPRVTSSQSKTPGSLWYRADLD